MTLSKDDEIRAYWNAIFKEEFLRSFMKQHIESKTEKNSYDLVNEYEKVLGKYLEKHPTQICDVICSIALFLIEQTQNNAPVAHIVKK